MSREILSSSDKGIFEIELNRPEKKNALTTAMYEAITVELERAESDPEIKVILMYGQPFCFSAGNDLRDFLDNPPLDQDAPVFKMLRAVAQLKKPLILAMNGPAVGVGTTICLHADLIYCGESAKFQLPFAKLGLVPEFASSYLLPRLTGHVKAFELLVLGEPFNAQTALDIGLINAIFDDEHYLTAAKQKALDIAKLSPIAVQESKRLLKREIMEPVLTTMPIEADVFSKLLVTPESKKIFASFLNK